MTFPARAHFEFLMPQVTKHVCSAAEAELTDNGNQIHQNRPYGNIPSCFLTQKPLRLNDVTPE